MSLKLIAKRDPALRPGCRAVTGICGETPEENGQAKALVRSA
ncbi:hypothetical protein NDS46_03175 [Paenibacillus thiaminolyticus]|nr:hypothetical protein [Paenibacillus thiaminolyticus]WCF08930.1 hypothetical protein NDS46_03175 [Paenibacillus thiaminolyticus]